MQCILTVAVAAVVTASHTELQAKSSPLALFSLLFPPCPPFILAITTFFFSLTYKKPSPETNIILWISFYLSHASGRDKQMPFQDKKKKKIVVNGSFSSCPWEHHLPLSALLLSAELLPASLPCHGPSELAAAHCPIPGCSCWAHPPPTAPPMLKPHGAHPDPR